MKMLIISAAALACFTNARAQKPVNKADSVLQQKYQIDTPKIKGDTMHYPRQDSIIRTKPGQSSALPPKQQ